MTRATPAPQVLTSAWWPLIICCRALRSVYSRLCLCSRASAFHGGLPHGGFQGADSQRLPVVAHHCQDPGGGAVHLGSGPLQPDHTEERQQGACRRSLPVLIDLQILNVKRLTSHLSAAQSMPAVYKIEMKHGEFTWLVKRKEKHFMDLHRELRTYKTFMRLPLPSRRLTDGFHFYFTVFTLMKVSDSCLQVFGTADAASVPGQDWTHFMFSQSFRGLDVGSDPDQPASTCRLSAATR